jgi:hypothetical protein
MTICQVSAGRITIEKNKKKENKKNRKEKMRGWKRAQEKYLIP